MYEAGGKPGFIYKDRGDVMGISVQDIFINVKSSYVLFKLGDRQAPKSSQVRHR